MLLGDSSITISLLNVTINFFILFLLSISALESTDQTIPESQHNNDYNYNIEQFNLTQILLNKFQYLFKKYEFPNSTSESDQSNLEKRRIDNESREKLNFEPQVGNYFRVLDKVFSRVVLPEVYKNQRYKGAHCALHVGCIEEIPNFPALLKKSNVSATFTIYTHSNSKSGHKIFYEPLLHYQLQDAFVNETELKEKIKSHSNKLAGRPVSRLPTLQPATSSNWRNATKIVHSQEYPFDLASLERSGFNSALNTRLIIGGYFAKEDEEWIDEVVKQWRLLEPHSNIIKVSWAESNRGLYHTAAYNSHIVGRQLSLLLHYMNQLFEIDLGRFHLVGHSLGAHIAGFVGADNEGRLARITGLDPAGPIFVDLNASLRLDPSDAKFVDVVHTNGGSITKGALGLSYPLGHVDYYCNGGSTQPGCYFSSVTKSIMDPVERIACNHRRSYRYFIEIIKLSIQSMRNSTNGSNDDLPMAHREAFMDCSKESCKDSNVNFNNLEQQNLAYISHSLPNSFLFEAKHDELIKLVQPEIAIMRHKTTIDDSSPPSVRPIEFHLINPEFPVGKRGMYFFRTRPESPFFATKHFALTIKSDTIIKRKIAISVKINQLLVSESEIDEIPGDYSIIFAPSDPKLVRLDQAKEAPSLSLMWRYRSFNLLLSQQNELQISGLEINSLEPIEGEHIVIKYNYQEPTGIASTNLPTGQSKSAGLQNSYLILTRNQWHKFEGRLFGVGSS